MKKISLFDLDHTLLSANSSYLFGAYLYKRHFFNTITMIKVVTIYFLHKCHLIGLSTLHSLVFNLIFLGKKAEVIQHHVKVFIDEQLENYLYLPAIQRLKKAQKQGHFISILSSSPDFLVEPIANYLGVEDWKATSYPIHSEGFLTTPKTFEGIDKAHYLNALAHRFSIAKRDVIAYSDSYLDLPFLKEAGTAIAVNPDRKLKKFSYQKAWEII